MLYLRWSPAARRSTSNNTFRNVTVVNGSADGGFRSGFALGTDDGSRQVDGSVFQDCLVGGLWAPGAPAMFWQHGWEIGSGTHGNNLDHYLYGCSWAQVRHGLHLNAANALLYGAQPGGAETDVFISGSASPIVIEGLRSEGSRRLLEHHGGAADSHVSLRDVQWNAQSLDPDGRWILRHTSGTLRLDNVVCLNPPAGTAPQIDVEPSGGQPASCVALGVATRSSVETAFHLGAGAHLTIMNYHQLTADNTIAAVTPLRVLRGTNLLFEVPAT